MRIRANLWADLKKTKTELDVEIEWRVPTTGKTRCCLEFLLDLYSAIPSRSSSKVANFLCFNFPITALRRWLA